MCIRDRYNTIGTTYGAGVNPNTFKLPDLRGRFPLGKDNMDNGTTVQDANNSPVDAGGGSAGRVTDTNAESLGGSGGDEVYDITDSANGQGTQYTQNTGSGVFQNIAVMNPYLTLNYIIRALK